MKLIQIQISSYFFGPKFSTNFYMNKKKYINFQTIQTQSLNNYFYLYKNARFVLVCNIWNIVIDKISLNSKWCFDYYGWQLSSTIILHFVPVGHKWSKKLSELLVWIFLFRYRIVASTNTCYYSENQVFGGVTIRVLCSKRGCY